MTWARNCFFKTLNSSQHGLLNPFWKRKGFEAKSTRKLQELEICLLLGVISCFKGLPGYQKEWILLILSNLKIPTKRILKEPTRDACLPKASGAFLTQSLAIIPDNNLPRSSASLYKFTRSWARVWALDSGAYFMSPEIAVENAFLTAPLVSDWAETKRFCMYEIL